jgi:hypothetical protein
LALTQADRTVFRLWGVRAPGHAVSQLLRRVATAMLLRSGTAGDDHTGDIAALNLREIDRSYQSIYDFATADIVA